MTWPGCLWLGIGLAVLSACFEAYGVVMEQLDRQEREAEALQEHMDRQAKTRARLEAEAKKREPELREARAVVRRLGVPWEGVFSALEQATRAHHDRIRVLAVQPDVEKRLVLLHGEAKDLGELMDYLDRIGESGILSKARLVNHQMHTDLPNRPIRFYAVAEWDTPS